MVAFSIPSLWSSEVVSKNCNQIYGLPFINRLSCLGITKAKLIPFENKPGDMTCTVTQNGKNIVSSSTKVFVVKNHKNEHFTICYHGVVLIDPILPYGNYFMQFVKNSFNQTIEKSCTPAVQITEKKANL
jgi:hypothetical protein